MFSYLRNYFSDWNFWDCSWTLIASITALYLGLHWGEGGWRTALGVVTSLTGLWCVILVAKRRILNYYVGIANILGYSYISYQYTLYGEVMLNMLYYLPMSLVGIWMWLRHRDKKTQDAVQVTTVPDIVRCVGGVALVFLIIAYGLVLKEMGDKQPFLDATTTLLSVVAMLLMVLRRVEQWVLWIIVDVASVIMWWRVLQMSGNNDIAILVMWVAYLINAIYGLIAWQKMIRKGVK